MLKLNNNPKGPQIIVKQNLYVIEKGLSNPQVLTIVKIAAGLGVTVEELTTFKFNYDDFLESPRKFKPRKH